MVKIDSTPVAVLKLAKPINLLATLVSDTAEKSGCAAEMNLTA